MGPYTAEVWRDDVTLMHSILARIGGIRWIKPVAVDDKHILIWEGGRHEEERLGDLCDWASEKWPA